MTTARIVALSDTHMHHEKLRVPDGDILIHAGDATNEGLPWEFLAFAKWFAALPHAAKIYVPGNHDRVVQVCHERGEDGETWLRDAMPGVKILIDQYINVGVGTGRDVELLKIYGTPWVPACGVWAWQYERGSAELSARALAIPDCDILVSHGPAYGICDVDRAMRTEALGCAALRHRLELGGVKHHVHGHIHHCDPWRNEGAWTTHNVACRVAAFDVTIEGGAVEVT